MTAAFWAIGAALAAAALWAILRPLDARRAGAGVSRRAANLAIHRDQKHELEADLAAGKLAPEEYQRALAELESRALEAADTADAADAGDGAAAPRGARRAQAIALGVAVPLLALGVYFAVGNPASLQPVPHGNGAAMAQIAEMVDRLAQRMAQSPEDPEGWKMLGRSYGVLGRFEEAARAYAEAVRRAPKDAGLLVDYADVLALTSGRSLQGEPERLVRRALAIEPGNLKALALAGTAEFDRGDYAAAARTWERMLPLVPPESEEARAIRSNVAEARERAGAPPIAAAAPRAAPPAAAAGVRGRVQLAPALRGKVAPGDTLFIYARAHQGPAMPLAILKRSAADLPLQYALDDSMAMAAGMGISSQPRVVITARVSRSGNARPQPGDLQGTSAPVANDAQGVDILIDTEVK